MVFLAIKRKVAYFFNLFYFFHNCSNILCRFRKSIYYIQIWRFRRFQSGLQEVCSYWFQFLGLSDHLVCLSLNKAANKIRAFQSMHITYVWWHCAFYPYSPSILYQIYFVHPEPMWPFHVFPVLVLRSSIPHVNKSIWYH